MPGSPAPWEADWSGEGSTAPWDMEWSGKPPAQRSTRWGATKAGAVDAATAGFYDELRGYHEASDLPGWVDYIPGGGLAKAAAGAYNVLTEPKSINGLVTGDTRGPYERRYEEARDIARQAQKTAGEEHPGYYAGGQFLGAGATAVALPQAALARGAGTGARALQAAKSGALYGGLYGVGSGEDAADRALQGGIGAAVGGATGAIAAPALDIAGWGASYLGKRAGDIVRMVRAEANPEYLENSALDTAAAAIASDLRSGRARLLTDAERAAAEQSGLRLSNVERGGAGETTLRLAKDTANVNPQARGVLQELAQERFTGRNQMGEFTGTSQAQRAAGVIRHLTGGGDSAGTIEALQAEARRLNAPAYERAYRAGDRPIWSPELERLTSSPDVRDAMRNAVRSSQSMEVERGYGGFNPGIDVTQDGRLLFQRGPGGVPIYPSLRYWDATQQALADMVERAQGREPNKARYLNSLHQQLNTALDDLVPEFQRARVGAWRAFQAEDAFNAGRNFVTAKGENSEFGRALTRMNDPERTLFSRGFGSELADKILEQGDNRNLLNSTFVNNSAARQRIEMAMGRTNARHMEVYLRMESLADRLRQKVMLNSTTAEQLLSSGMGLMGHGAGAASGAMLGEHFGGEHGGSGLGAVAGVLATSFLMNRSAHVNAQFSRHVAEMLASDDPRVLARAIDLVGRNPRMMNALRSLSDRIGPEVAPAIARGAPVLLEDYRRQD